MMRPFFSDRPVAAGPKSVWRVGCEVMSNMLTSRHYCSGLILPGLFAEGRQAVLLICFQEPYRSMISVRVSRFCSLIAGQHDIVEAQSCYQKRCGGETDLLTGSFYQYLATVICMAILNWSFETREISWHAHLIGALIWLALGLSVGAILLLMLMIRRGEVSRVASYFSLVPPLTAIEAWWLFDERLSIPALLGILLTVIGVYLVLRRPMTAVRCSSRRNVSAEPGNGR